jgi:signal-transduction protein with cAMP-binding, CBS, and nucleotidyltransferase domain
MEERAAGFPLTTLTAGEILREQEEKALSVTPDTTICDALRLMVDGETGSVLVMEGGKVLGIWTERDLMQDILTEQFDMNTARIGDHMSTDLHYASSDDPIFLLLDKFFGYRIRHLLIQDKGEFAGLLGMSEVIRASLTEMARQVKELNTMVSLDFYEGWKWRKKKKE